LSAAPRLKPPQVARHAFEVAQGGASRGSGRFERAADAMAYVIMDQRLFGVLDRALDRLQLLRNFGTCSPLFDHRNDLLQMSVSAPEALQDLRVIAVVHRRPYPGGRMATILLGGCIIAVDFADRDA